MTRLRLSGFCGLPGTLGPRGRVGIAGRGLHSARIAEASPAIDQIRAGKPRGAAIGVHVFGGGDGHPTVRCARYDTAMRFLFVVAAAVLCGCHERPANPPPPPPPYTPWYAPFGVPYTPPGAPPSYNPGAPPSYSPGAPPSYTPPPPPPPGASGPPALPPFTLPPFLNPGGSPGTVPNPTAGYRLPVAGRWRVARTHYAMNPGTDQAFAVDLIVDGATPEQTAGHANSEYPSYGRPILADGYGVIANAVDGVADNAVPTQNGKQPYGNFIVIDHLNGEFSLYAHLIPGSLRVHTGDPVAMGQTVASCGNTGFSTMPHLHYQIMDNATQSQAKGIPIHHMPYLKNGALTTVRMEAGDTVEMQQ